jgi:hypothetical protein
MAAAYMAAVLSERSMYIRLSCVETLMALSAFGPSAGLFRLQTTHAQRQHSLCLGGASDSGTSTADMHWMSDDQHAEESRTNRHCRCKRAV